MGQFLRIVILLVGLWLVLRIIRRALEHRSAPPPSPPPPSDMLRCEYCGVFVPRSEAVTVRGHAYCSGSHADADRA